jgi:Coenzyme F420-dependent N5,N10-methylene tetrahydromethanopterin reductase and related flavin-dependent oxidoreductases
LEFANIIEIILSLPFFSSEPRISVGIFSICAETDTEAEELALSASMWRQNSQRGLFAPFPTLEEAKGSIKLNNSDDKENRTFVGSPETVKEKLQPLLEEAQPEELKIITICEPFLARKKSYDLIKNIFSSN